MRFPQFVLYAIFPHISRRSRRVFRPAASFSCYVRAGPFMFLPCGNPKYPPPLDFAQGLCYIKMNLSKGGIMLELNEDVDDWIFGSEDQSNQVSSR